MDDSNTTQKLPGGATGKGFVKGDPRINRKGRPKSFDQLRELAQQIAHEPAKSRDGSPLVIDGRVVTVTEVILRQWAISKDPRLQQRFIEVTYGRVPEDVAVNATITTQDATLDDTERIARVTALLERAGARRAGQPVGVGAVDDSGETEPTSSAW